MSEVVYTDRDQPGSRYVFAEANPDLEARPNFERIEGEDIPQATRDAIARAKAEHEAVEAAATNRAHRVEARAQEDTDAAYASAVSMAPASASLATAAHYGGGGSNPPVGVLSRPGVDAVQIGPNPELHPRTREQLEEKARLDAEQANNTGVLSRESLSAKGGRAQIGDRPEQHPRNRAELLDAAAAGADGTPITAAGKALAGEDVDPDDESAGDVEHVDGEDDADPADESDDAGDPADESAGPIVDEPADATPAKATSARKATARKATR